MHLGAKIVVKSLSDQRQRPIDFCVESATILTADESKVSIRRNFVLFSKSLVAINKVENASDKIVLIKLRNKLLLVMALILLIYQ